jgi:large subunit ribosomal protein L3
MARPDTPGKTAAAEPAKGPKPRGPGVKKETRRALLGKKLGMTQVFADGRWTPVTVIQAGPCTVLQVKTAATDGYRAFQLGFDDTRKPRKWPQQAYLEKLGIEPKKFVREVPFVDPAKATAPEAGAPEAGGGGTEGKAAGGDGAEGAEAAKSTEAEGGNGDLKPGAQVGVGVLTGVEWVDVRGVTKGRGFQGVIRRYKFNAGPKSHGTKNIREPGSTGMHTDPGRVHKGKKMPGHMGAANRKARNLQVVQIEESENLLLVKGSVPGPNGGYLYIEESLKR